MMMDVENLFSKYTILSEFQLKFAVHTCWTHSFIIANCDVTLHYTRVPLPMRPGVAT